MSEKGASPDATRIILRSLAALKQAVGEQSNATTIMIRYYAILRERDKSECTEMVKEKK